MNGQEFKQWREEMGWSQTQAAAALNKGRTAVTDYESGRTDVPDDVDDQCRMFRLLAKIEARLAQGHKDELADLVLMELKPARDRAFAASQLPTRGRPRASQTPK